MQEKPISFFALWVKEKLRNHVHPIYHPFETCNASNTNSIVTYEIFIQFSTRGGPEISFASLSGWVVQN